MPDLYDLIIIGTGAGGGTLAHELAGTGKRILLLERGGYLPREQENWSSEAVFVDNRYKSYETWHDGNGQPFQPGIHYFVGGNTKFYGAVLLRLRERDFEAVQHRDGISPAWPSVLQGLRSLLPAGRDSLPGARSTRRRSDRST